jgi:hypothetical protein
VRPLADDNGRKNAVSSIPNHTSSLQYSAAAGLITAMSGILFAS